MGRPLRRRRQQGAARSSAPPRWSSTARAAIPRQRASRPGRTKYEAITLERGVTHDTEFEKWANKVWNFGAGLGAEVSLKDFRKDIIIEVYNEAGQLALAYKVFRCWVSEYQALPDLDANANAVAIQHIKLENEGWERDSSRRRADRADLHRSGLRPLMLSATAQREQDILALWDRAAGRAQRQRDDALFAAAGAAPTELDRHRQCRSAGLAHAIVRRAVAAARRLPHLSHRLRVHGGQRSARGRTCTTG